MSQRFTYAIQVYLDPGDGRGKRWIDTNEHPEINREDITEEDGWKARLAYLRAVRSGDFRLAMITTTIEQDVVA